MAALTLALNEIPGWIVGGDAIQMAPREVYRITPAADVTLHCFRSYSSDDVSPIVSSRSADSRDYDPLASLGSHHNSIEATIDEINRTLERGVDQVVTNPPFSSRDLADGASVENRAHTDYETAQNSIGSDTDSLSQSQQMAWLFTELGLDYTHSDGAVSVVVPTSILANPSDAPEREWLFDATYYGATVELPSETFAPETTTGTSLITLVPRESEHVGLEVEVDYAIFMAIAEAIGHNSQSTCKQLTQEGEPAEAPVRELPEFYTAHRWRGISTVDVPDDELIPIVRNHREMRTGN